MLEGYSHLCLILSCLLFIYIGLMPWFCQSLVINSIRGQGRSHAVRHAQIVRKRKVLSAKIDSTIVSSLGEPFGEVRIKNMQRKHQFSIDSLSQDLNILRDILNVRKFEVDLLICGEKQMRSLNLENRGMDKSTDILSFPLHQLKTPEKITKRHYLEIPMLGDLIVCPLYVDKQCQRDKQDFGAGLLTEVDDDDRGVSKAVSTLFTVQERIPLLLIHGMLHLLGHDHETDKDWKRMVKREEEVLAEYQRLKAISH